MSVFFEGQCTRAPHTSPKLGAFGPFFFFPINFLFALPRSGLIYGFTIIFKGRPCVSRSPLVEFLRGFYRREPFLTFPPLSQISPPPSVVLPAFIFLQFLRVFERMVEFFRFELHDSIRLPGQLVLIPPPPRVRNFTCTLFFPTQTTVLERYFPTPPFFCRSIPR